MGQNQPLFSLQPVDKDDQATLDAIIRAVSYGGVFHIQYERPGDIAPSDMTFTARHGFLVLLVVNVLIQSGCTGELNALWIERTGDDIHTVWLGDFGPKYTEPWLKHAIAAEVSGNGN